MLPIVAIFLPRFNALPIINQHGVIMSVSRNVIFIVLNHDEIAVTAQLIPDIDNFTRSRRINRRSARARNIDPYFRPPRWNKVKSLYR